MKQNFFIILLISLISCTKDLELPYQKTDNTMVVNCLFSENENWKVILTRIKAFNYKTDPVVENAKVMIVPENNDTIHLRYTANGIYLADDKPLIGIQYQLIIKDADSRIITSKSTIPIIPIISDIKISDQKTIYFSSANLMDYVVFPLNLKIMSNGQKNMIRFRFFSFNSNEGYIRYTLTDQAITKLRSKQISEAFLTNLSAMVGKSFSIYNFESIVKAMADECHLTYNEYANVVIPEFNRIKVNYRSDDSFRDGVLFANNNWLGNISIDTYNVLGEYNGTQSANLFVDYNPVGNKNDFTDYKVEYWLEVVGMSEDYYKYQKLYIEQIVNQSNPFASVIEVYSNINNGVGIFAGYNRQMIHLRDY